MKKFFYTLLLVVAPILVFGGQADTDKLLSDFSKKINGYKSVEIAFTFSNEQISKQNFTGNVLCAGDKFRLLTDEFEVYSDGRTKWLCSKTTDEIIIQYVSDDEESSDIIDNPLRFITAYQKGFTYKQKESFSENGKTFSVIEFTPTDKKVAYSSILLTLDENSAELVSVKYTLKDGNRYTIRVTQMTPEVEVFDGYFAFPKHKFPTAEIIDLR